MPQDRWDPGCYERFADERAQPFYDLMALCSPVPDGRIVDLGCGTGALTALLHRTLAAASTTGVDSSEAMLADAAAHADPADGLGFERAEIEAFIDEAADGAFELVFSNAALHWLGDHEALLARIARIVAPHGQVAIQVPANHGYPTHILADAVAREEPFRAALDGFQRGASVLEPEAYARLLWRLGFRPRRARLEIYAHVLTSREDVLSWVRGSLLTAFEGRLGPGLFERFLARYREALWEALPDERPFFYPFRRILLWARKEPR